ncbi:TIGR02611 family protein [Actinomycetospora sp. TBRC 11914]|uniref:TIGR02611 family protein n=1 Tax=Actinomycetospora sp. TBRC 11914 TaxID=2729387 RepID=UPI00145F179A|nr:TIGR02611 family protein [Actinomycetospora sp. TBRC 11914]NMO90619.1 TIGR02611 family protein [Actinomycetospora sp. TBRC 11914]
MTHLPASPDVESSRAPHDGRLHALRVRLVAFRARVRARPGWNLLWRIGIGVLGTAVLVLGVLAIPYPGPGWLIVFAGLGILATEFTWAGRVLRVARRYYDRWVAWVRRQNRVVQALLGLATLAVVLTTLWLLDALWLVARIVGLGHWTWLHSPIMA